MTALIDSTISLSASVAVPPHVVQSLVEDVAAWPEVHRAPVHAEFLSADRLQHWWVVDDHTVRTWVEHRAIGNGTIVLTVEDSDLPFDNAVATWTFTATEAGTQIGYALTYDGGDETLAASLRAEAQEFLDELVLHAQNRAELAELIIAFEDPLFSAGDKADAYEYLYDAAQWPQRIPHVSRIDLEETVPNVQFFDMDTSTPDGSAHTTRSVRICLPNRKIVYKQIHLPVLLDAHTGHWSFVETPEGFIETSRHTARIKPSALDILGPSTTVQDARNYLRRILSANSMSNLRLAKAHAESAAGF